MKFRLLKAAGYSARESCLLMRYLHVYFHGLFLDPSSAVSIRVSAVVQSFVYYGDMPARAET